MATRSPPSEIVEAVVDQYREMLCRQLVCLMGSSVVRISDDSLEHIPNSKLRPFGARAGELVGETGKCHTTKS